MSEEQNNLKIVPLYESNYRDVKTSLQSILDDDIEKDNIEEAVLVTLGDKLHVYGLGKVTGSDCIALLEAGKLKLVKPIGEA